MGQVWSIHHLGDLCVFWCQLYARVVVISNHLQFGHSIQAGELFCLAGTGSAMTNEQRALLHLIFRKSIMKAAGFLSVFQFFSLELLRHVSRLDFLVEDEVTAKGGRATLMYRPGDVLRKSWQDVSGMCSDTLFLHVIACHRYQSMICIYWLKCFVSLWFICVILIYFDACCARVCTTLCNYYL